MSIAELILSSNKFKKSFDSLIVSTEIYKLHNHLILLKIKNIGFLRLLGYSILSRFRNLGYYGKNTKNRHFEAGTRPGETSSKKYDDVCLSSWSRLDEFIQFITSFGIFSMLPQLGLTAHAAASNHLPHSYKKSN